MAFGIALRGFDQRYTSAFGMLTIESRGLVSLRLWVWLLVLVVCTSVAFSAFSLVFFVPRKTKELIHIFGPECGKTETNL